MSDFQFKYFSVKQTDSAMKVGTDAMLLGSLIHCDGKKNGLDIGTGTGVLSLMLAQRNPDLLIEAIEIDQSSCNEAKYNFQNSKWSDKLIAIQSDFLHFDSIKSYDLIFSNPPYYLSQLTAKDERVAKAKHSYSLPFGSMIERVNQLLADDGHFWLIIPFEDTIKWVSEAERQGFFLSQSVNIIGKRGASPVRNILCFGKSSSSFKEIEFVIRENNGNYSGEYLELTREYHARSVIR